MVPLDAYTENLTKPTPPPPPPQVLFGDEEPELLAESTTTREKSQISIFFESDLWTPRNYFFLTTVTQKNTRMSKTVDQYTNKKENSITFFRNPFFHRFTVDTFKVVLTTLLKDFRQVTENFRPIHQKWYIYFSYKKCFPQICPLDKYNVVLTNLWNFLQ